MVVNRYYADQSENAANTRLSYIRTTLATEIYCNAQ